MKILLIEDNPSLLKTVPLMLHRDGHEVETASDGQEAFIRLQTDVNAFDALVVDHNIPGMNGLELASSAKAIGFNGKIIIVSGLLEDSQRQAYCDLGINDIVDKSSEYISCLQAALTEEVD